MTTTRWTSVDSPIGPLLLTASEKGLTGVYMAVHRHGPGDVQPGWQRDDSAFTEAHRQLDEYFAGERTDFDLVLDPVGTPFQLAVWDALGTIPYGEVCSYGEIAAQIGRPGAARAVGLANGRNPISVIVPCHRVIGASGALTGYGGGLERKQYLLQHEAQVASGQLAIVP
jgi:methylated-DNA-[protein]-cysteine S-methyltransferase